MTERVTGDSDLVQLPGQGWLGTLLLTFSVGGLPLVIFLLRRLGRLGGLVVEAGCSVLLVRTSQLSPPVCRPSCDGSPGSSFSSSWPRLGWPPSRVSGMAVGAIR